MSKHSNRIRRTREDWFVDISVTVIMTIVSLLALIPLLHVISKAFSSEWALMSGNVTIYPKGLQFDSFKYVISSETFMMSFKNSAIVTVLGTALTVVITALTAYPLSKADLPFRKPILLIFVFTMLFSGGTIPTYMVMRQLKLTNTLRVLIMQGAINVYCMLMIKSFYESLPDSIEESAKIDGASTLTIWIRIVLPLCTPVIATVTLFVAVALWNNYFWPVIFNTKSALKTLPVYLRDIVVDNIDDFTFKSSDSMMNLLPEALRSATIVASTLPILILYPFLQKYFIKGALIGAVKG